MIEQDISHEHYHFACLPFTLELLIMVHQMQFNFNYSPSDKAYGFFPHPPLHTLLHSCSHTRHSTEHFQKRKHPIYFCCINKTFVLALSLFHAYMAHWESRSIINQTLLMTVGVNRFPWEGDAVLTSVWHFGGIRRIDWHSAWKAAENCIEAVESLRRLWLEHIMGIYLFRKWHLQAFVCSTEGGTVKGRKKC